MPKRFFAVLLLAAIVVSTARAAGFDRERASAFIELCHNVPGRQPDLRLIYWKLKAYEAADAAFDAAPYAEHVRSLQNDDGGFGFWPKDASSPLGTLYALTVLKKADVQAPAPGACIGYLNSSLAQKAREAERYNDPLIQRDVHACILASCLLGAKPPDLDRYLGVLEQDPGAWGIYYRLTALKAAGREAPDREALIERLDAQATEQAMNSWWSSEERHYALEAMHLLGGTFTYEDWMRDQVRTEFMQVREPGLGALVSVWRTVRTAKLLGKDTPWMKEWMEKYSAIESGLVGGYAAMPGMPSDVQASLWAFRTLGLQTERRVMSELAEKWKDRQRPDGYYESQPIDAPWFRGAIRRDRRIDETWDAVASLWLGGKEPANKEKLGQWLNTTLAENAETLNTEQIFMLLECFEMLGMRPENGEKLAASLSKRLPEDPRFVIRACFLIGANPDAPEAAERLTALLERVRTRGQEMEACVLADALECLVSLGAGYGHTSYFADMLGDLQNPDGGVRKPYSSHSNLYDTLAGLRMAKALAVLEERSKSGAISAPKTREQSSATAVSR